MSKKLFARGSDGLISISSGLLTETQLDSPFDHLSDIYLHTNLEYMGAKKVHTGTASFPTRAIDSSSPRRCVIEQEIIATLALDQPRAPMVVGFFSDGQIICDFTMIQKVTNTSWRAVGLQCDDNSVKIVEYYISYGTALASFTKNYTIMVLGHPDVAYSVLGM